MWARVLSVVEETNSASGRWCAVEAVARQQSLDTLTGHANEQRGGLVEDQLSKSWRIVLIWYI